MSEGFVCSVIQNALGNAIGNAIGAIFSTDSNPIALVCKCKNNVENLKQRVAELKHKTENVEHYVEAVHRRGKEIEPELKNWQTKANSSSEAADKLLADAEENAKKKCFFRLCCNPISRYQLSKQAEENSKAIADLVGKACGFNLSFSYIPAQQPEVAAPVKGFEDFSSRRDVLEKIMGALLSPTLHMIGVYGMPGVGKTTLVKEVKRKAKQEKLFDAVVMASVTRNPDLRSIQEEIARGLGLDQLRNDVTVRGAAHAIKAKLMKMKKVLIILDDIWKPVISLEELGILLENEQNTNEAGLLEKEHTKCKILLTSRDQNVLLVDMDAQECFPVAQLNDEEGLDLFKKISGDGIQSHDLQSTAGGIVKACGGLPLAITTIAKALRNKSSHHWRDALAKLQTPSPENFCGISANIYSAIEVSYFHLESEELKRTFLLCSLMTRHGSIAYLLRYGMGLGLFHGINTSEKAHDRVLTLIGRLKDSLLLLDGEDNMCFTMHDVVQNVAKSIASRDHHLFSLEDEEMPIDWLVGEEFKKCSWIDLWYPDTPSLPDDLECPQLTFFHLSTDDPSLVIPENFFKRMPRLRVLDLTGMHFSSLPSSIGGLTNLVTLCLDQSVLGDMVILGKLKNLEILTLWGSEIEELPAEMGQLTQLKILDLSNCSNLKLIPPHVLAGMYKLEELYLSNSFDQWEVEENENQRKASLAELKHLKKLTALEVRIGNVQMIPEHMFSEKLKRYRILIGDARNYNWNGSFESSKRLNLQLNASLSFDNSVKWLLKTTEELHLEELKGVKNVVDDLNTDGFLDLKYLYVGDATEVQYIINSDEDVLVNAFPSLEVLFLQNLINLEKIFQGQLKETAFNKLRMVTVESCDKLKNLFPSSIARQLLQLQEISVRYCSNMEEIVDDEEQRSRNDIVEVTGLELGELLRSLRLERLPKFRSLNRSCRSMQLFNEQVAFPNLEELQLSRIKINTIWHISITSSYVEKLRKLIIEACHNLEYLFSSSMVRDMVMLGHLEIRRCMKMREVLSTENVEENGNLIFRQLRFLRIENLPQLRRFCNGNYIRFPCLSELWISWCPELKMFVSSSSFECVTATSNMEENTCTPLFDTKVTFPKLERLTIEFMSSLDKIWDNQLDADSFHQLNHLRVGNCEKLLNIFPFSFSEKLQSLDKLEIYCCNSVEEIFESQGLGAGQSQAQNITHVTLGEQVTSFVFPTLTYLYLYGLPKLKKAFYHQMHSTEWPSLKKLEVHGCDQVQIFASELPSFPRTHRDDQLEIQTKCPLFWISKFTFPCLEELELERNNIMKEIWHGPCLWDYFPKLKVFKLNQLFLEQSVVQPSLCLVPYVISFKNLTSLEVSECHELINLVGYSTAKSMVQLTRMRISECNMLKEIVACMDDEVKDGIVFDKLKYLELLGLPRLASFCSGNLVSYFISFKNLTSLEVSKCHELINLVGFSIAKSMVQLTRMRISECDMLKEIVACMGDEVKDGIVFDKLKYLELLGLPRLASFCSGNCNFDFPFLEEVIVMSCPNMHIFSQGECKTYNKLQKVKSTIYEDEGLWEGNLNSTIQKMFMERVGYYWLEDLKLSEFSELIEIWNEKPQEILPFKRLISLEVCNCNSLRYLVTTSMALGLAQLKDLKVTNCATMEQVITGEGAEEMFPELCSIILESCPNLKYFYEGSSTLEFPCLSKITVVDCPVLAAFASSFSSKEEKEIATNDRESEERPSDIPTQPFFNDKIMFPNLEDLQLCSMNVDIIWHTSITSSCVEKLKKLIIQCCDNLEYLFSSSIARGLVMLGQLEIMECKRMREIIVTETVEEKENLIFPQLKFLLIKDLQNLVGFYSGNCIVEFLSLNQLQVLNCPKLEGFTDKYSRSTNATTNTCALFNERVAFPNLEWLTITHLKNLELIWHSKLYADSFCSLKLLAIENCEKLSTVFSSGDIRGRIWKSLEELTIYQCGLLEEIFEIGEFNVKQTNAVIDTKLRELNIFGLPRLKHVWNEDPKGVLTFHNLESVDVRCCMSLKILFPASIGKKLLQLQRLHLFWCGVEEVVTLGGEQGADTVVNFEFPRVSTLKLEVLPRLQCFYPGKHTTAWPMLKDFYFSHFNQVKRIDGCGQLDFPVQLPLFSIEKVIPQLEELSLTRHDIAMICERQFKPCVIFNVKVLQIWDHLGDESDVLPIRFLERFRHLEKLVVRLYKFNELFPSKEVVEQEKHGDIETLTRIKTLILQSLPYIKHVWSHDSSSVLQNLETLEISKCSGLIRISSSSAPFQNLTSLCVSYCKGMINFVSVSTAQSLAQLQSMTVEGCHKLIEIIENEGDGMQDFIIITFSKLKFLKLKCLTRLESFCSGNFTFKFPSLENVIVNQCPKLKIFSEGNLNTPLLHRIEVTKGEDKWRWASDLNTTIQKMYMEKVGFIGLEDLILSEFPEWMKIWHNRNPQEILDFRQLQILEIYDCNNFRYLLTPSMALGLVQLLQLIVKNCRTMEQVIMGEGANNQMEFPHLWLINLESCSDLTSFYVGSHSLELPRLNDFIVKDCPKMVTFATSASFKEHDKEESQYLFSSKVETPNLEFLSLSSYVKNLQKLRVEGCGNLKYLLTCSMVNSFEQLNWLEICDCKMMEEVILAKESLYDERTCKIFFPNLEFLLLQDLPKLTRFCSGNYLELPCLWKLKISKCPVLGSFISSFTFGDMTDNSENGKNTCALPLFNAKVAFPKLEHLVIEYVESLNKIWNDQLTADSFSRLTLMSVVSCEKVLNIFPFSMLERLKKLDKLQIQNCDSLEEIVESQELGVSQLQAQKATPLPLVETVTKFSFSKLTHLDLYGLPKLKGFFLQMHITEWPSLKKFCIYGCDQVQIFASELSSFQKIRDDDQLEIQIKHPLFWLNKATFSCLKKLILEKNNILKEIWNGQHSGDYLPKLKVVKLLCLREQSALPSFFFQSLPNLERLVVSEASFNEIFHCESLSSEERPIDTPTQLTELKLSKLNELRHLWKEESNLPSIFYNLRTLEVLECSKLMSLVPSIVSFENLQSLEVSRSHGLINLVRYSTAKSLIHLTRMSITDCDLIEEIVACWEDDVKDGIVFSRLKHLQLCGLPRLSNFCSVKCKFEFPFLEEVILMDCPSMQIFSMDEITTPKLQKVKRTVDEDEGFWDGNLNSTIQLQFMQKSGGDFEN